MKHAVSALLCAALCALTTVSDCAYANPAHEHYTQNPCVFRLYPLR